MGPSENLCNCWHAVPGDVKQHFFHKLVTFSTACSIMYKLQHLCAKKEQRTNGNRCLKKKKDKKTKRQKEKDAVSRGIVLRSDQDFNFYVKDQALRTTGVQSAPSPLTHSVALRQLQCSPRSTSGPGQEGARQCTPHTRTGESLGESEHSPRTTGQLVIRLDSTDP